MVSEYDDNSGLPIDKSKLLDEINSFYMSNHPYRSFFDIIRDRRLFINNIINFHPIKSASLISGLLIEPTFHANTLRLEILIHLLFIFSNGFHEPRKQRLNELLNSELGSTIISSFEDPVEDVFIGNVTTGKGNFRIFNGTWESSDFYLQRILNVVTTIPDSPASTLLSRQIYALLGVSEEIARRRNLSRYEMGDGQDKAHIGIPDWNYLKTLQDAITFTAEQLSHIGISPKYLQPFILKDYNRDILKLQSLADSALILQPIVEDHNCYYVLLPNAISAALRNYIFLWMDMHGYQDSFDAHLIHEYEAFLTEIPFFGLHPPVDIMFPAMIDGNKYVFEYSCWVDEGCCVQTIAIIDSIKNYLHHGLISPDPDFSRLDNEIESRVSNAKTYFHNRQEFRKGLTIIIDCGYGRPSIMHMPENTANWPVVFISAPDYHTLAWLPKTPNLDAWKMIYLEEYLKGKGFSIENANGLLNLYGWWKKTNYMMLPEDLGFDEAPMSIHIPTDYIASLRAKVRQEWDPHALPLPSGKYVRVQRKSAGSYFLEDVAKPQYGCIDAISSGKLLAAWAGRKLLIWIEAELGDTGISRDFAYRIWDATINWMDQAVPAYENIFTDYCEGPHIVLLDFNMLKGKSDYECTPDEASSCLSILIDKEKRKVNIIFRDPFAEWFQNPSNVAEREIINAITRGLFDLFGLEYTASIIIQIVDSIVRDRNSRFVHAFNAVQFRDYIQHYDRAKPLFIEDSDEAKSKLGLGKLVSKYASYTRLTTPEESSNYLNDIVDALWMRIRERLLGFDRECLIYKCLWHIEGIEREKERWERTLRAMISLRNQNASTKEVAMQYISRCNASTIALRIVIEMALSECPFNDGSKIGVIDLASIMSDAACMFHLGGWSDAIKKGVMEPEVEIAPCGDILAHTGFRQEISEPMGKEFESIRLDKEISIYEKHYEEAKPIKSIVELLEPLFIDAFHEEFGIPIDALREFRDLIEDYAIEKKSCIFVAREDEIISRCRQNEFATESDIKTILDRFSLWPREKWCKAPEGYEEKDWYPWRFGRQLSLLARPIVRINNNKNPTYIISPGIISTGIALLLTRYHDGENIKCKSSKMRSWIDKENNRRGHSFVKKVYETMIALGYKVRKEVKVSELVNENMKIDYGDVDVLAWKPNTSEVLAIECKDLKIAKTSNEVAEQLNRFSGNLLANGKRDDLKKHLDRCDILRKKSRHVACSIGERGRDIEIKTMVCFSQPVPMNHMARRFPNVQFVTLKDLMNGKLSR